MANIIITWIFFQYWYRYISHYGKCMQNCTGLMFSAVDCVSLLCNTPDKTPYIQKNPLKLLSWKFQPWLICLLVIKASAFKQCSQQSSLRHEKCIDHALRDFSLKDTVKGEQSVYVLPAAQYFVDLLLLCWLSVQKVVCCFCSKAEGEGEGKIVDGHVTPPAFTLKPSVCEFHKPDSLVLT